MPRPVAHLANLDLNLLVALRELLRERSVTRAAERLGVTQPAASAALSRLRRHFADELLVGPGEHPDRWPAAGARVPRADNTSITAPIRHRTNSMRVALYRTLSGRGSLSLKRRTRWGGRTEDGAGISLGPGMLRCMQTHISRQRPAARNPRHRKA